MTRTKTGSNMVSFIYKPLCIVFLLLGLFGLIRLRSNVLTINYDIRTLEEKKMTAIKDLKTLLAEREKCMSLEKIDASFRGTPQDSGASASVEQKFGSRVRTIHIKRGKGPESYKASLEVKNK